MRKLTVSFVTLLLLLLASTAMGSLGADECGVDDYDMCMMTTCQSGCKGPLGETPCCKPPPYRVCICDYITYIRLPTTIIYTYPESVYSQNADGGFASNQILRGNFAAISMNPLWVMYYGYGVNMCSLFALQGRILSSNAYGSGDDWLQGKEEGHIEVAKEITGTVPTLSATKIEDRIIATSYELFYRAYTSFGKSGHMFSFSPYADQCYPITDKEYSYLQFAATEEVIYAGLDQFLNKFTVDAEDMVDELQDVAEDDDDGFYDSDCSDSGKAYEDRAIYFIYEAYHGDVFKSQVEACDQ